jgi:hypothetical protein
MPSAQFSGLLSEAGSSSRSRQHSRTSSILDRMSRLQVRVGDGAA